MKYLKSYKIYESTNSVVHNLLSELKADKNLNLVKKMKAWQYQDTITFQYESDANGNGISDFNYSIRKYTTELYDGSPISLYELTINYHVITTAEINDVKEIYEILNKAINSNEFKLYKNLLHLLDMTINKSLEELSERIDEFQILDGNKVDMISLNQLYDYYEVPFSQELVSEFLGMKNTRFNEGFFTDPVEFQKKITNKIANKVSVVKKYASNIINKDNKIAEEYISLLDSDIPVKKLTVKDAGKSFLLNNTLLITYYTAGYLNDPYREAKIDNKLLKVSDDLLRDLYNKSEAVYRKNKISIKANVKLYNQLVQIISVSLRLDKETTVMRIDEFDVVNKDYYKDITLDLLNLEKLFEFCGKTLSNVILNRIRSCNVLLQGQGSVKRSLKINESNNFGEIEDLIDKLNNDSNQELARKMDIYIYQLREKPAEYYFKYEMHKYIVLIYKGEPQQGDTYILYKDFEVQDISQEICKSLYDTLSKVYNSNEYLLYRGLLAVLIEFIPKSMDTIQDKFEEFDILDGIKIDWISLNSLYDYYKVPFNKDTITEFLRLKNISFEE